MENNKVIEIGDMVRIVGDSFAADCSLTGVIKDILPTGQFEFPYIVDVPLQDQCFQREELELITTIGNE